MQLTTQVLNNPQDEEANLLTERWYDLRPVPAQIGYKESPHRFNILKAGRRSGKTERFKRKLITRAMEGTSYYPARFFAAAPTRDQAKKIFWDDLKAFIPKIFLLKQPSETELKITLVNGSEIYVVGLDKPQRIEGQPWDGGGIDEFDDTKEGTWEQNIRPLFSDRDGWCDLFGVPNGRRELFRLYKDAKRELAQYGEESEWGVYEWTSAEVLSAKEIRSAKKMDKLIFQQEYEAEFINFEGKVYHSFDETKNVVYDTLEYDPFNDLILCFDFNVSPGIAVVIQEQWVEQFKEYSTGIIDEIWIPRASNTQRVIKKIIEDYGAHEGRILCYGDASGGSRKTSADINVTDWSIIRSMLTEYYGEDRVFIEVPKSNPDVVARINAVNARLCNAKGERRLAITGAVNPDTDRPYCEHTIIDFDSVTYVEGGAREIDKSSKNLTHITDAIGYYIQREFPLKEQREDKFGTGISAMRGNNG